jgi:hypothetical protein
LPVIDFDIYKLLSQYNALKPFFVSKLLQNLRIVQVMRGAGGRKEDWGGSSRMSPGTDFC